jgi:hypothetical protein
MFLNASRRKAPTAVAGSSVSSTAISSARASKRLDTADSIGSATRFAAVTNSSNKGRARTSPIPDAPPHSQIAERPALDLVAQLVRDHKRGLVFGRTGGESVVEHEPATGAEPGHIRVLRSGSLACVRNQDVVDGNAGLGC